MLAEVAESFAGMPLWRSVYRGGEPVGVDALRDARAERCTTAPTRSPYRPAGARSR